MHTVGGGGGGRWRDEFGTLVLCSLLIVRGSEAPGRLGWGSGPPTPNQTRSAAGRGKVVSKVVGGS